MRNTTIKKVCDLFKIYNGTLSYAMLKKNGFDSKMINKLIEEQYISRLKKGLYNLNDFFPDGIEEAASYYPDGIFCLESALAFHDLITYIPDRYKIAYPRNKRAGIYENIPVDIYYFSDNRYNTGIDSIKKGRQIIKNYDPEKSLCDAVFYRNKIGKDIVYEAVRSYMKNKKRDINKLMKYAKSLRAEKYLLELIGVVAE